MVEAAAVAIDGGDLPLGGGLLALVRPALARLAPGGVLVVRTTRRAVAEDLPAWCRLERHVWLGAIADGEAWMCRVARGDGAPAQGPSGRRLADGAPYTAERALAALPMPDRADPRRGAAPRDARVEAGGPAWPFSVLERDRAAPPEIGHLYDQGSTPAWDPARDVPWDAIPDLPEPIEAAVVQVMTFLAENELAALYVPARWIPRIHPAYVETSMFLATQLADEARHIDAFTKRARAVGGAPGLSAATTSRSLASLLDVDDFTEASFLLSVLGEGTFLDLLRYVERHAPEPATAEVARRARLDEARHVRFGMAHVRHALGADPALAGRLEAAVRRRAATMAGEAVPAALQDALVLLAAAEPRPARVAAGHAAFRRLLDEMHDNRLRRLQGAGFSRGDAERLSALHTPNFM